jgi:hypothetical protein
MSVTKAVNRIEDLDKEIASVSDVLESLNVELSRMPSIKKNSTWHTERAGAKHACLQRLDILRRERRILAEK